MTTDDRTTPDSEAPESLRDTEAFCASKDPHAAILAAHDSERRRALAERDDVRAENERLREVVDRVEALHTQHPNPCDCIGRMFGGRCFEHGACDACRHQWPCPTVVALTDGVATDAPKQQRRRCVMAMATDECGAIPPNVGGPVPCHLPRGHAGQHFSTSGCAGSEIRWHDDTQDGAR